MDVVVGILVGGASLRMGRPKALIEVEGITLIERTTRIATTVADRVVLLGQPLFKLPPALAGQPLLPDAAMGAGPIAGLASLLRGFPGEPGLLLACDMPYLQTGLLKHIVGEISPLYHAVAYATGSQRQDWQPCCAVYMPTARGQVEAQLAGANHSLQSVLNALNTRRLTATSEEERQLFNFNSPIDLTGSP